MHDLIDKSSEGLVQAWMHQQPTQDFFENCREALRALSNRRNSGLEGITPETIAQLLDQSKEVADLSKNILKKVFSFYKNERPELLDQLNRTFEHTARKASASPEYARVYHPATEAELQEAVRNAAQDGLSIRTIGSNHSPDRCYYTDGLRIVLDRYNSVLSHEGNLVTAQAGMQLRTFVRYLENHGQALPSLGGIQEQTLGGFFSPGSQGGTLHHSAGQSIVSIRVVLADGSVTQVNRGDEHFNAFAVSFGTLGVISTYTFETVPSYSVKGFEEPCSFQDVLDNFIDWSRDNDWARVMWWVPIHECEVLLSNKVARTNAEYAPKPFTRFKQMSANTVLYAASRNRTLINMTQPSFVHSERTEFETLWTTGISQEDGLGVDLLPHVYSEMYLPVEQAPDAFMSLYEFYKRHPHLAPTMPFEIYCSPASPYWMHPAYNQPSVRFNLIWYGHDIVSELDFFRPVWEHMKEFKFRFHWSKAAPTWPEFGSQQLEHWDDFLALREKLDPQQLLLNPHYRRVLGIPELK